MTRPIEKPPRGRETPDEDQARSRDVGKRLRNIFDDVAAEPLPDAFEALLRQLE